MPDARAMIVTGASSGIGRALALAAAAAGYHVALVARRADRLDDAAREIRLAGGTCTAIAADVAAADAPARIVDLTVRAFGGIDVLVNNAGGGAYGGLLEQSDAAIEAQWQTHVAAPLRIARAALPYVEQRRGVLVFVGSGLARVPLPMYGAYAPVKAAIRAAAIQLRRELRPRGIAVTYVDPGLVATEFHAVAGIARGTHIAAAAPERVARAILRGIRRRAPTVHGVPWQTAATALAELTATLADPTLTKLAPQPAPISSAAASTVTSETSSIVTLSASAASSRRAPPTPASSFTAALEPVARRMERVKLSPTFVRDLLVPEATLELNEVAMRWAGMPNKNERAAMREVLDALAAAGYLQSTGEESWRVTRAAES
ncbi:MAG TPA: SDR family NAD(P)-dependent oxidoreductase [Candidatus Baltobacteraceae bacterium]|nr:SDR family NAD(P)-dependent oxidoreductase [Candidatus Baltobacteraceae bacterium]